MNVSDYYRILDIPENAGIDEIKNAFRRKAKAYHPDINKCKGAHQKFIDINEAYTYLVDLHASSSGNSPGVRRVPLRTRSITGNGYSTNGKKPGRGQPARQG
jgi:curved DNA-binding protein